MASSRFIKRLTVSALAVFTTIIAIGALSARKNTKLEVQPGIHIESRPLDSLTTEIRVGRSEEIRNLEELEDWLSEHEWVDLEITFVPSHLESFSTYYNWADPLRLTMLRAKVYFAGD
jgi:hypothetical protein